MLVAGHADRRTPLTTHTNPPHTPHAPRNKILTTHITRHATNQDFLERLQPMPNDVQRSFHLMRELDKDAADLQPCVRLPFVFWICCIGVRPGAVGVFFLCPDMVVDDEAARQPNRIVHIRRVKRRGVVPDQKMSIHTWMFFLAGGWRSWRSAFWRRPSSGSRYTKG